MPLWVRLWCQQEQQVELLSRWAGRISSVAITDGRARQPIA